MKKLIESIRQSFSAKLSFWVVIFTGLVFLAAQILIAQLARDSVRDEAVKGATQVLDNTELRLNSIIEEVERAADNLEWLVYRHLSSPDTLLEYSRITVQGMDFLTGCSISFEPYFINGQKYFSAYSSNTDGVVETTQEGDDDYQYFYLDWYLLPKLLNQPCWTEPYSDWEYDDDYSLPTEMLISYCKPLTAADGSFIGSISLDISLKWLSETLSNIKPYPNSYSILVSRGGSFIVHPDPEKLFYQTIFTNTLLKPDPLFERIGQDVISGKSGIEEVTLAEDSFMFYKPMRTTGWSLAIICPKDDIFVGYKRLRTLAFIIIDLGLLLLFVSCFFVIRRTMKPLVALADEAENIASGDFNPHLPEVDRADEIGTLSRSFAHMQSSLASYIDVLTATTANKERIEGELRIAHNIQMRMIPNVFPPFPERQDIDLYAFMSPAREVGGDLYDYFILDDKLYFCIGDVSGKGIPASLVMAVVVALFRNMGRQGMSPHGIASRLNTTMSENNDSLMFITFFIGLIDLNTGHMEYCNCGHNPPVLLTENDERLTLLDKIPNIPLGVDQNWMFAGQSIEDVRNSTLFLYTDGLTEAENQVHEEFGERRMQAALRREAGGDARAVVERLRAAAAAHVGAAEPSDDLTMLCLRLKNI